MDNTLAGNPVRELARSLTNLAQDLAATRYAGHADIESELASPFRQLAVLGSLLADRLDELALRPGREFEDTLANCVIPWLDTADLAVRLAESALARRLS